MIEVQVVAFFTCFEQCMLTGAEVIIDIGVGVNESIKVIYNETFQFSNCNTKEQYDMLEMEGLKSSIFNDEMRGRT